MITATSNYSPLDCVPEVVFSTLDGIGISRGYLGYKYLAYSIHLSLLDCSSKLSMTKHIYPSVAEVFNTKATRVERAIRTAIQSALDNQVADDILYTEYKNLIDPVKLSIKNSHFIYTVASKIHRKLLSN